MSVYADMAADIAQTLACATGSKYCSAAKAASTIVKAVERARGTSGPSTSASSGRATQKARRRRTTLSAVMGTVGQPQKRKSSRRSRGGGESILNTNSSLAKTLSAPTMVGTVAPRMFIKLGAGKAQANADLNDGDSLRVHGNAFLGTISTSAGGVMQITTNGGTASANINITPKVLDSLTANTSNNGLDFIEAQYDFYAFRYLRFEYRPSCSSSTAGAIAFGLDLDPGNTAQTGLSQILAMMNSTLGSVWAQLAIEMKNSGTRLYDCYAGAGDVELNYFADLNFGATNVANSTNYGVMFVEFVCDFYCHTNARLGVNAKRRFRVSDLLADRLRLATLEERQIYDGPVVIDVPCTSSTCSGKEPSAARYDPSIDGPRRMGSLVRS